MKLRVLGGLSLRPMLAPLGADAVGLESSRKGERGEVGDIFGEGVRAGSGSADAIGMDPRRFLGSAMNAAEGESARSGSHEEPVLLVRCETSAVATSTCGDASVAGDSTLLAGLTSAEVTLCGLLASAAEVAGGVKPILMTGSVLAVSRLLRGLLDGSWLSRRPLGLMRKMGDEDDPRNSWGRRAFGRPSTVVGPAGELESNEVEGERERFIESDNAEGEEPATGEMEPIRRS